jgi:hypothetical protein
MPEHQTRRCHFSNTLNACNKQIKPKHCSAALRRDAEQKGACISASAFRTVKVCSGTYFVLSTYLNMFYDMSG